MVYNSKTFEICHKLTEEGKEAYRKLLEKEADEILFKKFHPFLYIISKIKDIYFNYVRKNT